MDMEKIFIYGIYNPDEPEIIRYVGKTKKNVNKRLKEHIYLGEKKVKRPLYLWINKLLQKNKKPEIIIIEETNNKEWASKEIFWIKKYKKTNNLLNLTDGGESNLNYIPNEETRKKISLNNIGKHSYWKNKKLSKEHKDNIGKSLVGKKRSDKTKKNISESLKGRKLSEEHKLKLSVLSPNKGKQAKNIKSVNKICLETGNIIETYMSLEIAAKENNIKNKGNIVMVCQGKRNKCGGFLWKYVN
jgi:group I intron endonuclease